MSFFLSTLDKAEKLIPSLESALIDYKEQLSRTKAALSNNSQPCPFCGKKMYNLQELRRLPRITINSEYASYMSDMLQAQTTGQHIPNEWECQDCGASTTPEPLDSYTAWTRSNKLSSSKTRASKIFNNYPNIITVSARKSGGIYAYDGKVWYFIPDEFIQELR